MIDCKGYNSVINGVTAPWSLEGSG